MDVMRHDIRRLRRLAIDMQAAVQWHSALSYGHASQIEAKLKAEVAELMARAEAADAADVADGACAWADGLFF